MAEPGSSLVRLLAEGTRYGCTEGSSPARLSAALAPARCPESGCAGRVALGGVAPSRACAGELLPGCGPSPVSEQGSIRPRPTSLRATRGSGSRLLVG